MDIFSSILGDLVLPRENMPCYIFMITRFKRDRLGENSKSFLGKRNISLSRMWFPKIQATLNVSVGRSVVASFLSVSKSLLRCYLPINLPEGCSSQAQVG